jgi:cytochrome c-type biogenesis protein CcmH/NrfG
LGLFAGARHVHAALGRLYHNQLDLERAAEAYQRRVAVAPNDGIGHADLGDVYRAQDRLDDALVEYLVSALLRPDDPRGFAMAGQVLVSTGRDVVAVRMLEAAIRRDSRHLEARYALARALMRLGRTDAARAELQTFGQLQAEAMAEERRRFEENARRIDEALTTGAREPQR